MTGRGQQDDEGRPCFPSQNQFIQALIEAKHASGNADGQAMVKAITADYSVPDHIGTWGQDRPILTGKGPRKAKTYTWRGCEQERTG